MRVKSQNPIKTLAHEAFFITPAPSAQSLAPLKALAQAAAVADPIFSDKAPKLLARANRPTPSLKTRALLRAVYKKVLFASSSMEDRRHCILGVDVTLQAHSRQNSLKGACKHNRSDIDLIQSIRQLLNEDRLLESHAQFKKIIQESRQGKIFAGESDCPALALQLAWSLTADQRYRAAYSWLQESLPFHRALQEKYAHLPGIESEIQQMEALLETLSKEVSLPPKVGQKGALR
jgi:hypothetical protein